MGSENASRAGRKGWRLGMRRVALLPRRYGVTEKKFLRNLEGMVSLLRRHDVVGTFPVTAVVLERHPKLAGILDGMEAAIHGLRHTDLRGMDAPRQETALGEAIEILKSHDLEPAGFRAPYLGWSGTVQDAVARAGLVYDSSVPAAWSCGGEIENSSIFKEAVASYGIVSGGGHLPSMRGPLVVLPVAVPDDEILVDRLGIIDDDRLVKAMASMLEEAMREGTHLVLQLHPERFTFFRRALDTLLSTAREKGAWVAPLKDAAVWWRGKGGNLKWPGDSRCALTISGDIDAVALFDFALRRLGR